MSEQDYDGLSDEIRARLLVSVTQEDADFIQMVVRQRNEAQAENARLRLIEKAARALSLRAHALIHDDDGWDLERYVDALDVTNVALRSALSKKEGE